MTASVERAVLALLDGQRDGRGLTGELGRSPREIDAALTAISAGGLLAP